MQPRDQLCINKIDFDAVLQKKTNKPGMQICKAWEKEKQEIN